tara:strand:+ start:254 stop:481 length:228 start_codon:yes stop_codon:yes gene_type:complete
MSERHTIQDASRVLASEPARGISMVYQDAVPSDTTNTVGYAKGCIWVDSANANIYIKTGADSAADANWKLITRAS